MERNPTEVVIVVKTLRRTFYGVFASCGENPDMFEESLIMMLKKYSPMGSSVWKRYPCENSRQVRDRFFAEVAVIMRGFLFEADGWLAAGYLSTTQIDNTIHDAVTYCGR